MMATVKRWLLGVVLTAFSGGLAGRIAPKGKEQTVVRLVSGLLLLLAILRPLGELAEVDFLVPAGDFSAVSDPAETENQMEKFSAIIAEKTAAYIWDKAYGLGLDCRVTVTVKEGEVGIPLPYRVTVAGPYSAELAAWLDAQVGIPADRQIWLEEGEWNTMTENES